MGRPSPRVFDDVDLEHASKEMDGTGTLLTVRAAIEAIKDVPSNSSTEFSDYVDYAVVLDQILQHSHFAEPDKKDLLASLENVLAQNVYALN